MLILSLLLGVIVAVLAVAWRVLAAETSARAAAAVLALVLVGGFVTWALSNASFDAG